MWKNSNGKSICGKNKKTLKKRIRKNFPKGFEMMELCPHEVVEVSPTPTQANGIDELRR